MVNPGVLKDLIDSWSFAWIVVQDLLDKVSCVVRNANIFREVVSIHSNATVSCLDI